MANTDPIPLEGVEQILALNEILPEMQEHEFVQTWLLTLRDFCAGEPVNIGLWLEANDITPFKEVQIMKGREKLFKVPSIMVLSNEIISDAVASDLANIAYKAENMDKTIPGAGTNYMRNELKDVVKPQKGIDDIRARWDAIFVKYGLEPVYGYGHDNIEQLENSTITGSSEFDDYDEL